MKLYKAIFGSGEDYSFVVTVKANSKSEAYIKAEEIAGEPPYICMEV